MGKMIERCAALMMSAVLAMGMVGCSSGGSEDDAGAGTADASAVRVGTMPTEDMLPLWVAESEGMSTENGTAVEVISFDSAQALSAAIASGDVDMAMTDIMRAVKLTESGTPVTLEWVTLGETAKEGRFGVLAPQDAPYDDLAGLAEYGATADLDIPEGVGVGANTVPEYVFDKLSDAAGVDIPVQEVASLPERYSLVASGQLLAAALPASLLALGEASGMKVIADDTHGENISQSVMVARSDWAAENPEAVLDMAQIWDAGVNALAAEPDAYRSILVEKANLNASIAGTYPISAYPYALRDGQLSHPSASMVEPVLSWMTQKGYGGNIAYESTSGQLIAIGAAGDGAQEAADDDEGEAGEQ